MPLHTISNCADCWSFNILVEFWFTGWVVETLFFLCKNIKLSNSQMILEGNNDHRLSRLGIHPTSNMKLIFKGFIIKTNPILFVCKQGYYGTLRAIDIENWSLVIGQLNQAGLNPWSRLVLLTRWPVGTVIPNPRCSVIGGMFYL